MSTIRIGGVRFRVHPQDHEPRHVHAYVGEGAVIIVLGPDRRVTVADRADSARNVKASDIRKVVRLAAEHFDELVALWEQMNG